MKKINKWCLLISVMIAVLFLKGQPVDANETMKNVSVTVPASVNIIFREDGSNQVTEFAVENASLVPIVLESIRVTEYNDWELVENGREIPVNTKNLVFCMENYYLHGGENAVEIYIDEESTRILNMKMNRGVWTMNEEAETAFTLEFLYAIGEKEFQIYFDGNGGNVSISRMESYNGELVNLPVPRREGYVFAGWQDEDGNLYNGQIEMPVGDLTLTAIWKELIAYAICLEEDYSLRFIRSSEPIEIGDEYDGYTVTGVYTGFEESVYTSAAEVPWYDKNYYKTNGIRKVIVEDVIRPISTAFWFQWMYYGEYFDLENLDTSSVEDMQYMFAWTGFHSTSFTLNGLEYFDVSNVTNMEYMFAFTARDAESFVVDCSQWDVSSVTNMYSTFIGVGYFSTTFSLGDLSIWNVESVTNMKCMFQQAGQHADWYLDLSGWNVSQVKAYANFDLAIEDKVNPPIWVK